MPIAFRDMAYPQKSIYFFLFLLRKQRKLKNQNKLFFYSNLKLYAMLYTYMYDTIIFSNCNTFKLVIEPQFNKLINLIK